MVCINFYAFGYGPIRGLQTFYSYCPISTTIVGPLVALLDACSTLGGLPSILYYLQHIAFLHRQCLLLVIVTFSLQVTTCYVFQLLLTLRYWLLPSYGNQQLIFPKATTWYTLLCSILEEKQKCHLKGTIYFCNLKVFNLKPFCLGAVSDEKNMMAQNCY